MLDWEKILYIILPALMVFVAVMLVLNRFFKNEESNRRFQAAMANKDVTTPLRFRAYERMILFLERMSPDNLTLRVQTPEMTALQLLMAMQNAIREEYEHNLSQQLYLTNQGWAMVVTAKEGMLKFFNSCATKIDPKMPAFALSKIIIESYHNEANPPTKSAINFLKKEIKNYF